MFEPNNFISICAGKHSGRLALCKGKVLTELKSPVDGIVSVGVDAGCGSEVPSDGHPLGVCLQSIVLALIELYLPWVLILSTIGIDLHTSLRRSQGRLKVGLAMFLRLNQYQPLLMSHSSRLQSIDNNIWWTTQCKHHVAL